MLPACQVGGSAGLQRASAWSKSLRSSSQTSETALRKSRRARRCLIGGVCRNKHTDVHEESAAEAGKPLQVSDGTAPSTSSKAAVLAGTLLAASTAAILLARSGLSVQQAVQELENVVALAGPGGPVIFAGAYVASTVLLFPASLLTLGAGFLYGPVQGTALVSAASTLGASAAFLISRYLARPLVVTKLQDYPRFKGIDEGVSRDGGRIVFLLRLSPLLPFSLLNYALGVTNVPFRDYVVASWAGMLPGTFAYVYAGSVGKAAVAAAGEASGSGDFEHVKVLLWVAGAIATLAAVKLVSDAAGRALGTGSSDGQAGL